MNIKVYLKGNLARFPRSWDTNSYPFEVEEENYLMSANMIEITRDDADEFDKKKIMLLCSESNVYGCNRRLSYIRQIYSD
ncbi:hypothetical protein [Enterococcus faecium]|uniref:hypothetical protein n=1 Tax=Enterococcus faecium TaxID=1352 RepID=UPI0021AE4237|nr:hypothetical protein [Enterococcus faecium]